MTQVPTVTLSDGATIPQLAFGTWQVPDAEVTPAVLHALQTGYRHIDTAAIYGNEAGVGRAIAQGGVRREELYVTTKLWNDVHAKADVRRGIESSLEKLGLDHVDLYLIHWPSTVKHGDAYIEAWDALQEFKAEGLATSIGVSNFHAHHLDAISGEVPVVNQVEVHPTFAQVPLRTLCAERGITVESWSPLGSGADLGNPELAAVASELGRSVAQVIIRWHLQHGLIVLPKSVTPARIEENFSVFDFELDADTMARIDALDAGNRVGADPDTATF
ncbi:MAG: aldo/keto reductase [Propionibacteriaceae bacterium]|nr:aldo/keto reductase [Propionibacteriaceae bacterium]